MGFYGNIRNTTSNSFKFDRIYSNRTLMELSADSDGIFGGRYVLVEYDQALDENPTLGSQIIYSVKINNVKKYYTKIITELNPMPKAFLSEDLLPEEEVYYIKFDAQSEVQDLTTAFPFGTVFCEQEFKTEGGNYTLFYTEGLNPIVKQIVDIQIQGADETIKEFTEYWYLFDKDGVKQAIPNSADNDWYTVNYGIDKAVYGLGRGYDSTVWRKTYSADGKAKYVNIADLNSVVPTFAVTAEAPYDLPTKPHYDKDSTNVYYNLHLQTPWNFRIADVSDANSKIKKEGILNNLESDVNALKPSVTYDSSGHYILRPDGATILDEDTDIDYTQYPGAIYFNKAGFDKEKSVHSRFEDENNYLDKNQIRIDNYSSGMLYPNRNNPADNNKQPYADTKELSIILPAIGDTIASMWDLIYGTQRKLNISWDDANSKSDFDEERLRLVHNDNYTPEDSETIAGIINSAHDLMGMIITDPSSAIDGEKMPNEASEAHQWQIYYNPSGNAGNPNYKENTYYYAGTTLDFEELHYPFLAGDDGVPITEEAYKAGATGTPMATTAESFREYFSDENQGYVKVNNLRDIKLYVNNTNNKPLFSNYDNGNIYKRVPKNIEFANPNELYYNIPTKLTYIAAVMRPNDGKEWYYHPNGNTTIYQQLPMEEKMAALSDSRDYFWIDQKLMTKSGGGSAYIMSLRRRPLFRVWTLENIAEGNIESNRKYAYSELPHFPDYYRRGLYTSFDDILEEQGVTIVNGDDGQKYGKKVINTTEGLVNQYYDLNYIYYITGTRTYYDEEHDEWITGNTYKSRAIDEILFPPHQITQDNPYYLYKITEEGNVKTYTRENWGILVDREDLSNATDFKYEIKETRLKREGECYYFKIDTSTEAGQNKMRELNEWVADEDRESDELNIETAGYLNYIFEFNRNKQEDSLNPNYHYFIAQNEPVKVGYGIAEKKSIYEDSLTTFYTEKTLYFHDDTDNLYKKAERANEYTFVEGNDLYRKNNEYYIVDCGDFNGFNIYQKLNIEIIQEDDDLDKFFKAEYIATQDTVANNKEYYTRQGTEGNYVYTKVPKAQIEANGVNPSQQGWYEKTKYPLVIGYGFNTRIWKELPGFARDINTLHGWLLRLNEILQPNDTRTRDSNTIQGCINQMNDLLDKFGPLVPGDVLMVDEHGRINSRKLADIILKSDGEPIIGTLTAPSGDVDITTSESLRSGIEKLIAHINAGASNITLKEYNNYYNDAPYFVTSDKEKQPGKTYYIKQGNTFVVYSNDPWPENHPTIYEKYPVVANNIPDVDNNDNINEAIAKLQWQLNHIANRKLTDLTKNYTASTSPLADTDTLGQGLHKLQNRIYNIENFQINGVNNESGLTNIFAGIVRSDKVPTNLTTGVKSSEISVPALRSGWIWVNTSNHYVYIKTQENANINTYEDNFDGYIKRNYWELLNAWQ